MVTWWFMLVFIWEHAGAITHQRITEINYPLSDHMSQESNHLTIHFLGPTQEPHVLFPALAGKAQCNSKELADLRDFFTVERWKREILPEINAKNLQLFCKDSVKSKKHNTAQLEGSKSKRSKCIRSVHFIPCRVMEQRMLHHLGPKHWVTVDHEG